MKIERVYFKSRNVDGRDALIKIGPFPQKEDILPGQFFEIKWAGSFNPLIPRPLSLFYRDGEDLFFFVKQVGRFTRSLFKSPLQKEMLVFGPLGVPFPLKEANLIGGGTGIAPLFYFSTLFPSFVKGFFVGFKTEPPRFLRELFDGLSVPLFIATEDGSLGFKGTVVELFEEKAQFEGTIFLCGPETMLKKASALWPEKEIYVSLEGLMACGTGICMGCAVEKKDRSGYLRICKDGPVFNLNEILL